VSPIDASELAGRVAIVTGGGQGIGRATALELARLGADVVVAELNGEAAERTAKEVRGLGRKALALRTDVTRRSDLTAMVDPFGRVIASLPLGTEGALDVLLPAPLAPTLFSRTGLIVPVALVLVALAIGVGLIMRGTQRRV